MRYVYFIPFIITIIVLMSCDTNEKLTTTYSHKPFISDYLRSPIWDQGKALISYYTLTTYEQPIGKGSQAIKIKTDTLSFSVLKHLFDIEGMKKADEGDGSAKEVLLFSILKRNGIYKTGSSQLTSVQMLRDDLRPVKVTLSEQSYEGNTYIEQQFNTSTGQIQQYILADAKSFPATTLSYEKAYYALEQLPFLVTALNFNDQPSYTLDFITYKLEIPLIAKAIFSGGHQFALTISKKGEEKILVNEHPVETTVIDVHYPDIFPPLKTIGHTVPISERYYVRTSDHKLVKMVSAKDEYGKRNSNVEIYYELELLEELHTDWWNYGENVDVRKLAP